MKLRVLQSIENDNYSFIFSIDPASISSDDSALFDKHGDQPINFGGTITNGEDSFVLPDTFYNLPSAFPVKQTFTIVSPSLFATSTDSRLAAYRTTIEANVTTAMTDLRALGDTFTGEFITNI